MIPGEENTGRERLKFELRAAGIKSDAPNPLRSGIHTRGYLPHVKREGACYFVTFRLADSLAREVLLKLESDRAERMRRLAAQEQAAKQLGTCVRLTENSDEIERDFRRKLERYLDQGVGMCWLGIV